VDIYYNKPKLKPAYVDLVNDIITELEKGVLPWNQTWKSIMPISFSSGEPYIGINILALLMFAAKRGFASPYWLTQHFASQQGGRIKKEEISKSAHVIQAKWELRKRRSEKGRQYIKAWLMMKTTKVYNLEQTQGITDSETVDQLLLWGTNETAQNILDNYEDMPAIKHDYAKACYRPYDDVLYVPKRAQFKTTDEYYSTIFHELIHSTGHPKRLKRSLFLSAAKNFNEEYSKEELVAELGAAFLCGHCGITYSTIKDSSSYIASWLKELKDDRTLLFTAASQAQKAVLYILNKKPDSEEVEHYESDKFKGIEFYKEILWV